MQGNDAEDEDDRRVHSIFGSLRAAVVDVGRTFGDRLRQRLDRAGRATRPSLGTVVSGLVVELLNLATAAVPERPEDGEDD